MFADILFVVLLGTTLTLANPVIQAGDREVVCALQQESEECRREYASRLQAEIEQDEITLRSLIEALIKELIDTRSKYQRDVHGLVSRVKQDLEWFNRQANPRFHNIERYKEVIQALV